jgi:hypothetical protein
MNADSGGLTAVSTRAAMRRAPAGTKTRTTKTAMAAIDSDECGCGPSACNPSSGDAGANGLRP